MAARLCVIARRAIKDGTPMSRVSKHKISKRRLSSRSLENMGQATEFDTDHEEGSSCKQCTLCMVYVVDQAYMNSRASSHHRRGNAGRSRHDQSTPQVPRCGARRSSLLQDSPAWARAKIVKAVMEQCSCICVRTDSLLWTFFLTEEGTALHDATLGSSRSII